MISRPRKSIPIAVAFMATVLIVQAAAPAQSVDLAERMPAETLFYFGWAGCDHAVTAAKDTALGKTLADPQVKKFFKDLDSAVMNYLLKEFEDNGGAEGTEACAAGRRLILDVCRHPGAIALTDFGFGEMGPFGNLAVVLQLGDRAEGFGRDLQTIMQLAEAPPSMPVTIVGKEMQQLALPVPGGVCYGAVDGFFILAVGMNTVEQILNPPAGGTLAQSESLTVPRQRLGANGQPPATSFYLNVAGALERARMLVPMFVRDEQKQAQIWQLVSALGLDTVKSVCWEMYYRQQGCFNGIFVHTTGAPTGLFAVGSGTKLTDGDLALIPKDAYWASVFSLDLGKIYSNALQVFKEVDPENHQDAMDLIAETEEKLGLRLGEDLLNLMGEKFVLYDAPQNGGVWFTGATFVLESSDPEKLQAGIGKIVQAIATEVNKDDPYRRHDPHMGLSTCTYRDHQIEFVNVTGVPMPFAPAWTTHDKHVIVALYPQMVMAAVDRMSGDHSEDSLLANDDFKKGRQVLGGIGSTMTYLDTGRGLRQLYGLALPFAQMGAAMAQGEGMDINIASFPTQRALTQHMFGHVATTQHLDDGVLYASYGPLPLGVGSIGETAGAGTALATSIMLPSLARARQLAKRQVSQANLKAIGMACKIYANDQADGQFPPSIDLIIETGYLTKEQLTAPVDDPGAMSYVYVPGYYDSMVRPMDVLAYERRDLFERNGGQGLNVLFGDAHVEWVKSLERFDQLLQESKDHLARMQRK